MATLELPPELARDRSSFRLTQLAKRVAVPRNVVGTDWGPIDATCRDEMGLEFDGWQDGAGQLLLARQANGKLAHTVGGFGMSVCRQAGKTTFIAGALFGMCQHFPGLLVIWTAQHSKTHMETFLSMQAFAGRRRIEPFIQKVFTGSGDEEIRFWNGSRILFGARERGFGRGIPGVDVLIMDEGQILSEKALQNMLATLNTSRFGLHIYLGTPPTPENNSEAWLRMRDEAWVINDPSVIQVETEDLVWIEMGADDGADLDDPVQWAKANPSFPHRTPVESIMRLRRKLNDDGFRREGMGVYDVSEGSVFDIERWNDLKDPEALPPERATVVIDVSPDRRWSAIGVAGEYDETKTLLMALSMRGTEGVAAKIADMESKQNLIDIAITPGAARALETDLNKFGIVYDVLTSTEIGAGYATLQEKIKSAEVVHLDQAELNFAMINSKSRFISTGESETFDRRNYSVDLSPAVAVASALYRFGQGNYDMPYLG